MAVSQSLTITQSSQSVAGNYSKVRILWKSTQTGESWNGYTRTAKYYVSVNGGSETEYSVSYTLPKGSTATIVDTTITVNHKTDGTGTVKVRTWMDTDISAGVVTQSKTLTLDTIPRASNLSASNGTLGTEQTMSVSRNSDSFTHTITYSCGDASGTICSKSSSTSVKWTPPLALAQQNTTGSNVSIKLTIKTYSGSSQVGDAKTTTITAAIPSSVKPTASLAIDDYAGYKSTYGGYVQGKSQISVELTGSGAQNSTIKSYRIDIGDKSYSASSKTANLLSSGDLKITGTVTDSRFRTGSASKTISVIPYSAPKITSFTAYRCSQDGTLDGDGAYAKLTFSAAVTPLNNKNSAYYSARSREEGSTDWTSHFVDDFDGNYSPDGVSIVFAADTQKAFEVCIVASDDFGDTWSATRTIPVAFALLQTDSTGTGLAVGQQAVDPNTFAVGIPMKVSRELLHGGYNYFESDWIDLGLNSAVGASGQEFGHYLGCAYRVIGRHVYVAFACSFEFTGDTVRVNQNTIPSKYCPARNTYAMCATGERAVARCLATPGGNVVVDWVQILSSSEKTVQATVSWLTGYIDYWI